MRAAWREHRFPAPDGTDLYARDYGPESAERLPVLCLAGLTRNSKDFHGLAERLGADRRVIAPDYRGRGRSGYASDWSTYRIEVELADALLVLDRLGVERVVLIGTSRGGLVAMTMAATHKQRLAGVLLNDIGPRLEPAGLNRIAGYLGRPPKGDSWETAVEGLKESQVGFDTLSDEEWLAFAHRLYRDDNGRPRRDYDPALRRAFPSRPDIESKPLPEFWPLFSSLAGLPAMVLRGENSDLLSERTLAAMAVALPGIEAVTVPDRGHAPFLDEPASLAAIDRLLARAG